MEQWTETEGARDNLSYPLLDKIHKDHAKTLNHSSDDRILDIGCGRNPLNMYVREAGTIGIDPDYHLVSEAKSKIKNGEVACGLGDRLPFEDNTFDLVFMRGVVHHLNLNQRDKTFNEIQRVLKTGGEVHIFEPDPESSFRRVVWYVSDKLGYEHEESPHIEESGYVTISEIMDLCDGSDLEITTQSTTGSLLSPLAFVYPYDFGVQTIHKLYKFSPANWWSRTVAVKPNN